MTTWISCDGGHLQDWINSTWSHVVRCLGSFWGTTSLWQMYLLSVYKGSHVVVFLRLLANIRSILDKSNRKKAQRRMKIFAASGLSWPMLWRPVSKLQVTKSTISTSARSLRQPHLESASWRSITQIRLWTCAKLCECWMRSDSMRSEFHWHIPSKFSWGGKNNKRLLWYQCQ